MIKFLVSSPYGDVPVNEDKLGLPLEYDPMKTPYGVYFQSIKDFLERDQLALILSISSKKCRRAVRMSDVNEIIVRTEKHGALYHPASLELILTNKIADKASSLSFPQAKLVGNHSENEEGFRTSRNDRLTADCNFTNDHINNRSRIKFGLNVAVSETGRDWLKKEYEVIKRINSKFSLPYLPTVYSFDDQESMSFLVEDWFEGYHEFHLSISESGKQCIKLWEYGKGDRYLSAGEAFEVYRQASKILTLYYDINDFSQIFPWHHAGGDFVAKAGDDGIDLRLTTARQYEPYIVFREQEGLNPVLALFFFFLNLTIRMRLDKIDGVGDTVWADDFCLGAAVAGFFEALKMKEELRDFFDSNEFLNLLKSFGTGDLKASLVPLIDLYAGTADHPVIIANLDSHMETLRSMLQDFLL